MKKKTMIIGLSLLIIGSVSGFFIWDFLYSFNPSRYEVKTDLTSTNTDPVLYTTDEQIKIISQFANVEVAAFEGKQKQIDYGMYVIPGLKATKTLTSNAKGNYEVTMCTSMTPQGMTLTKDYLLISAYCHTKEHNSVIWVLNRHTHAFIKEIVLEGKPHAGGLAYDDIHENIWVCSKTSKVPQLVSFSLKTLESYDLNKDNKPIKYSQRFDLTGLKDASFVGYKNGYLYAGYFKQSGISVLQGYVIAKGGELQEKIEGPVEANVETAIDQYVFNISNDMQGMSVYNNKLLLSRSNGAYNNSHLLVFDGNKKGNNFEDKDALMTIAFPERMEQIVVDGNELYVLFESASYAYRNEGKTHVDHVLKIDLHKLFALEK